MVTGLSGLPGPRQRQPQGSVDLVRASPGACSPSPRTSPRRSRPTSVRKGLSGADRGGQPRERDRPAAATSASRRARSARPARRPRWRHARVTPVLPSGMEVMVVIDGVAAEAVARAGAWRPWLRSRRRGGRSRTRTGHRDAHRRPAQADPNTAARTTAARVKATRSMAAIAPPIRTCQTSRSRRCEGRAMPGPGPGQAVVTTTAIDAVSSTTMVRASRRGRAGSMPPQSLLRWLRPAAGSTSRLRR